jgi:Mg2+-importing ATPase
MESMSGLSTLEAQQRIEKYGFNTLPKQNKSLLRLIFRQFSGIFNLLLIGAAAVTFFLGEPIDAAFILFFVFLGTGLNVYQEYKANNAADKLKSYLIRTITVVRDGQEKEISIEEIVPGES